jgi:hypothetical protein
MKYPYNDCMMQFDLMNELTQATITTVSWQSWQVVVRRIGKAYEKYMAKKKCRFS